MKYLIILLCLSTTTLFAQTAKYFNSDSIVISKQKFDNWRENGTLPVKIAETKDTVYYQAVKRSYLGKLSNDEREQLYTYLSSISAQELNKQLPIVVFYHQGIDKYNSSGTATIGYRKRWYKELIRILNKKTEASVMLIYSTPDGAKELYPSLPAYYDKYRVFSKFFKYHYPSGCIMVINPNGNFAYYLGEYGQQMATILYADTQTGKRPID